MSTIVDIRRLKVNRVKQKVFEERQTSDEDVERMRASRVRNPNISIACTGVLIRP